MRGHSSPAMNLACNLTMPMNNFEIRGSTIGMIYNSAHFDGLVDEDHHYHQSSFLQICSTCKINSVSDVMIRLRLFSFSLREGGALTYGSLHQFQGRSRLGKRWWMQQFDFFLLLQSDVFWPFFVCQFDPLDKIFLFLVWGFLLRALGCFSGILMVCELCTGRTEGTQIVHIPHSPSWGLCGLFCGPQGATHQATHPRKWGVRSLHGPHTSPHTHGFTLFKPILIPFIVFYSL